MAGVQNVPETEMQDKTSGPVQGEQNGTNSWLSKPESLGNDIGEQVQSALQPVGNAVGGSLSTVVKPVGGVVDGVVGGVMRSGEAFADATSVGSGSESGAPGKVGGKQQVQESQELKKGLGGKEERAGNPLGL